MRASRTFRILLIATAVLAVAASTALAVNLSGDGALVGSTGSDNITAGNGNDTIWGQGGGDNITAGNGNDMVDPDGKCGKGVASGVYQHGLPAGDYCAHGAIAGEPTSNITAGSGNDVIFGGGGQNNIKLGNGADTVYGGLVNDNITVGTGTPNVIHTGGGADTIKTGTNGGGTIYAQNGQRDFITCSTPNSYTVYASTRDVVKGCATVKYTSPARDSPSNTRRHVVRKHAKAWHRSKRHAR